MKSARSHPTLGSLRPFGTKAVVTAPATRAKARNLVLDVGQEFLDPDTGYRKIGDGVTPYNLLQPVAGTELDYCEWTKGSATVDTTVLFAVNSNPREMQGLILPNVIGGPRPIKVVFETTGYASVAGIMFFGWLIIDNVLGTGYAGEESPNTADSRRLRVEDNLVLSPGFHTVEAALSVKSGTATVLGGISGGVKYHSWLQATQL